MPTEDKVLRAQLISFLKGGQAHVDLRTALADFPVELAGEKPHGLPYSAWQLLEHLRFTLHDLLAFCTNPEYSDPQWPEDYWPREAAPASAEAWEKSVRMLKADLGAFEKLASEANLSDTIPWGKHNETLLREVLLAIDHNSYHTGELIVLRRLLGIWPI